MLEGVPVRCVAADGDRVIVGTQGAGALLSGDGGRRWERMELPEPDVFSVAIGSADGTLRAVRLRVATPERGAVEVDGVREQSLECVPILPVERQREASDQLEYCETVLRLGCGGGV